MADQKKPLGVLILHGFTGSLDTVSPVATVAQKLALPWRMPVLRGHGTRFEDLVGVTPRDWFDDAEKALKDLLDEVEKVVVVGLSMGGLVGLNLAIEHEHSLAGLILLTPALRFADPLIPFTPLIKVFFQFWDSPSSFNDATLAKRCTNYPRFPTATFSKLLDYSHDIERRLGEVRVPVTTLYSRQDKIIHPIIIKLLEDKLGSKHKRFVFFEKGGHEMLQDSESAAVSQAIEEALGQFVAQAQPQASA